MKKKINVKKEAMTQQQQESKRKKNSEKNADGQMKLTVTPKGKNDNLIQTIENKKTKMSKKGGKGERMDKDYLHTQ